MQTYGAAASCASATSQIPGPATGARAAARSASRGRLVGLTDKGRELVDAAVTDHLENEERLLSGLDPAERDQLAALLRKLLL